MGFRILYGCHLKSSCFWPPEPSFDLTAIFATGNKVTNFTKILLGLLSFSSRKTLSEMTGLFKKFISLKFVMFWKKWFVENVSLVTV